MTLHRLLIPAGLALLLAACGDSPQDIAPTTPPPSNEVPASAVASPRAYSTYAASLTKSETEAPVAL